MCFLPSKHLSSTLQPPQLSLLSDLKNVHRDNSLTLFCHEELAPGKAAEHRDMICRMKEWTLIEPMRFSPKNSLLFENSLNEFSH